MDQHLKVFVTVVEKRNFSRAGEELHMTQPAVTQYIKIFEREIGTRLLERSNKYVRLTQAGEIVYHYANEILGVYKKMQRLVDDAINHTNGPITIASSYTFGEYVLPKIMADVITEYPDLHPSVVIGNSKEVANLVLNHQAEVGLIEGEYENQALTIESFDQDEMYIVTSSNHPLQQKQVVSMREISESCWLVRERGSGTRSAIEKMLLENNIQPTKKLELGSTQLIKESICTGLGISMISKWAIREELANGKMKILQVKGFPYKRNFSIVTQSPYQTKAVATFIEKVKNSKWKLTNET